VAQPPHGRLRASACARPAVLLVEVERGARVIHRRVLARLDGQAQVLGRQVPQRARPRPPARRGRAHQRREARRVAHVAARVAQLQRLRARRPPLGGGAARGPDPIPQTLVRGVARGRQCLGGRPGSSGTPMRGLHPVP